MQGNHSLSQQRGVTLIEACMTLAIASILVGTAAPSLIESNTRRTLDGSAGELVTDLYLARSAATSHQQGARVSFHTVASGSCVIVHTGDTADCTCDGDGVAQCSSAAVLIKGNYFPGSRGVAVSANVRSIRFDPTHGMATPAGTVRLTTADGHEVHHVVNVMGRVRTCSPGASAKGYKAC
jgi:type IV fimbrial biogenesis protein FimT